MARPPMFQRATVTRIVKESVDARTFVLAPHDTPIEYRAGQFCTFRVAVDGRELFRSYSMSSAPETDTEFMTTVKRVPGGAVSNWMHDNLAEGDVVEISQAAGRFCLRDTDVPLLGFSGGSGITPIISLAKSALATTSRKVRLLCADRDQPSMIFEQALADLVRQYPDRLEVTRHLDAVGGFLTPDAIREFAGVDGHADSYICGPEPFMEMIELALPGPGLIYSERFGAAPPVIPGEEPDADTVKTAGTTTATPPPAPAVTEEGTVTIILNRKKKTVPRKDGETLLESARRATLSPPFSCEAGNCATCMGKILDGKATMRQNNALADDEIEDGYILTCQGVPDSASITVTYDE
ncbi:ferredoxin--NADP reductase [Nocardia aurantia]|uniref:3-ketosteroid-9-alpha-monooxygenase, ferredoxin reductase component n=1 Tax=Nocardia aurantia TaxID=2585199 RepID=A0A7K0DIR6_9NOCA|nr:ferredoxin--NADP reductase [Nocardia aurantia]MQY25162.1 3-ketosteroid-9-alpha-monooxygenase, ferredoxin reductase component [Nocardia aurantia]